MKSDIRFIQGPTEYSAVNTQQPGIQKQCVNAVQTKSRCLFWDLYTTNKRNVSTM
jgi:hypothetical protein